MAEVNKADLKNMKGISSRDAEMIADAEQILGPEPSTMGAVKNLFWGNFREELYFPYPEIAKTSPEETAECDQLVAQVEEYMINEHPSIEIDQEQYIPEWVIKKLFDMGVLGMTIPKEFGGLSMGITSYNRILETLGKYCGSTAVMVSAHQSIGCKAVMLYGTDDQKKEYLPKLAREWLSAFCLSEPQVGCDAGGQETTIDVSECGEYYIVNGEKKWATSGAISGLFTVMGVQQIDGKPRVSAVICTPDMEGIEIFSKNRSKMCIRGTWQARIKFTNVKVPRKNLLHKEGKGLGLALTCLNYGRCTLSAGMLGGAKRAMDQSIKWSQTRYQFKRPIADFELVQKRVAYMSALCYAMDSVLYMTTGMLDRHDDDIMLETAICKVFCSEMGWRTVDNAMQIMGGEGTMTENELERIFRDSRINTIVEGANEVMQSFIFAYGGKQLAEKMLGIKEMADNKKFTGTMLKAAIPLGMEVFLGMRKKAPTVNKIDPSLRASAARMTKLISELTYQFKVISKKKDVAIVTAQATQARLSDAAMYLHAWSCTLSRLDKDIRNGESGTEFERNKAAAVHFFDVAELAIHQAFRELHENADDTMLKAAELAFAHSDTLDNKKFAIPESSPSSKGTGRELKQDHIKQFPGTSTQDAGSNGRAAMEETIAQL
tara:strand:- start:398506 stop:400485 length:1980 start_codon:yes stop_codon:yes gene_type:complete